MGKGLYKRKAVKWLNKKYEENSELFHHCALVHPKCMITFVIEQEELAGQVV